MWRDATEKQKLNYLGSTIVPLDYPNEVAEDWPELLEIVRNRVKPERDKLNDNADGRRRKERWWLWGRYTPTLYSATKMLDRVLVCSGMAKYYTFAQCGAKAVFSHNSIVFVNDSIEFASIIQSDIHTTFAEFFGSTLGDGLGYRPTDCLEPFPFPNNYLDNNAIRTIGDDFFKFRAGLLVRNQQGLTTTYNRFHDPQESDPGVLQLRALHRAMDEAVLRAYGWDDLPLEYGFYADFEPTEDEDGEPAKVRLRYRWPNSLREEVLGRLLALNAQRAAEEEQIRQNCEQFESKPTKRPRKSKPQLPMAAETSQPYLLDPEELG
jgi:hypothetical protein